MNKQPSNTPSDPGANQTAPRSLCFNGNRFGTLLVFLAVFTAIQAITRTMLLIKSAQSVDPGILDFGRIYGIGLFYDLVTASYYIIPAVVYLTLLPDAIYRHKAHRLLVHGVLFAGIFSLLFGGVSEWFFWDEFGKRFNFIAVDYLVYTNEVIGNIMESYPVYPLLALLLIPTALIFWLATRNGWFSASAGCASRFGQRALTGCLFLAIPILSYAFVDNTLANGSGNTFNDELAKNGTYELFAAFRNNRLDYDSLYLKKDQTAMLHRMRELIKTDNAHFLNDTPGDITRHISNPGEEKRYNIMFITIESYSRKFMGAFGSKRGLTPNTDKLADESILFTNFHATGTRTVRGLEALTLSTLPTPGRSIVKRPGNENMFSLGFIFKERGYDTRYIYGGYGYFDNMNYFFANNGFSIVDRTSFTAEEKTFGNIWGLCDEDLFNKAIKEADNSHADGTPFFNFVMTTSNHRPYTYPEGKIDIPIKTGRSGGVKYTDYALGEFFKKARTRPWFDNTIFVVLADHCSSSAGRVSLPVNKYEIPLIIYNPKLFPPQKIDTLSSQIDVPPTLLGLLNWSYTSRFLGKDIFKMKPEEGRAFIGNYQKLGLYKNGELAVLTPSQGKASFIYNRLTQKTEASNISPGLLDDAIACYQSATWLYKHRANRALTPADKKKVAALNLETEKDNG